MGGWQIFGTCLFLAVAGYLVGHQHGSDQADLALKRASDQVAVPVASPHASVCSTMLEAAWSIEDVPPEPSP